MLSKTNSRFVLVCAFLLTISQLPYSIGDKISVQDKHKIEVDANENAVAKFKAVQASQSVYNPPAVVVAGHSPAIGGVHVVDAFNGCGSSGVVYDYLNCNIDNLLHGVKVSSLGDYDLNRQFENLLLGFKDFSNIGNYYTNFNVKFDNLLGSINGTTHVETRCQDFSGRFGGVLNELINWYDKRRNYLTVLTRLPTGSCVTRDWRKPYYLATVALKSMLNYNVCNV